MKFTRIMILAIIAAIAIAISFYAKYASVLERLEYTAKSEETMIRQYIRLSDEFIEQMTIYGSKYFSENAGKDSDLYSLLEYDSGTGSYSLDGTDGIAFGRNIGNLTGLGSIPDSGKDRNEINLALSYNEFFVEEFHSLSNIAWLYYTSENDFILMYPWIHSDDFLYSRDLKDVEFYKYATPSADPLRSSRWTNVYLDQAGKGFMVTLSSPIYDGDAFKGVLSLDLTNKQLSEMFNKEYDTYLVDASDSIIATSLDVKFEKDIIELADLTDASPAEIAGLNQLESGVLQRYEWDYVYAASFGEAPWRLYVTIPVWIVAAQSLLFVLPILLICGLLILMTREANNRRKTEKQLSKTLEDLKTYHVMLENVAKYDFLTGTFNRRGFKESFRQKTQTDDASDREIAIVMCDIDYFKQFNDTYGHPAGDRVLVEISNLMKDSVGADDIICRWGGEEFMIVLFGKSPADARIFAETMRREIECRIIPLDEQNDLNVTMTFGIAGHSPGADIEGSIIKADRALYKGKQDGRNRVASYEDEGLWAWG